MQKLFTCEACKCSYQLKEGEEYSDYCDKCQHPVLVPGGAFTVDKDEIGKEVFLPFTKHDTDKLAWNLLPMEVLEGAVRVLMHGAKKYDAFNWQKGTDYKRYYNAAMRHIILYWQGETYDTESSRHHLDHALCCLMFLRYFDLYPDEYNRFDDRPGGRRTDGKTKVQGVDTGDDKVSEPELRYVSGGKVGKTDYR